MRALCLLLAAAGSAAGQINLTDLAITGDGGTAYFTSALPLKDEAVEPGLAPGRIFRTGPAGFELYMQRPRIDPPPAGPGLVRLTNYFQLSRAQASRDGGIVAVTGARVCSGSSRCASETTLQTTVTGLPGGPVEVTGSGRLSGNGRYLLITSNGSIGGNCSYVADLLQPGEKPCVAPGDYAAPTGRAVADDGTAVVASGSLYILQSGKAIEVRAPPGSPGEAVIDSSATVIVYSLLDWRTNRRSIRIYRVAEGRDAALAAVSGEDSHAPYVTADGRRVMFLSGGQIYTVPAAGGTPRQVTRDASGVLSAAMSDDGKAAWYFSGAGRLYSVSLDTGETRERLGRTPQIGFVARMTAGSIYSLPGAGFADVTSAAASFPLPRSLGGVSVTVNGVDAPLVWVAPTEILLQAPYGIEGETRVQVNTEDASPFIPQRSFAGTALASLGAFLYNPRSPSAYGGWDAFAIHEDWSALVTQENPARPSEIVHLYGTGFGRVDPQPADGEPSPFAPTLTRVTCWAWGADNAAKLDIPVFYSGLAPGLAGIYQLDVLLPASNLRPSVQLNCAGEGDSSNFYGSFAVGIR
ncbi:MAG: hypothetical protein ACE15B_14505 [Bryobacteraceae bacterium]